jgi:sugar-specific transcriptional regulator TrmB
MYQELFEAIGLNDHEAKVYEILLASGPSAVRNILKKIDLTRTNLYNVLNQLKKKGLVGERLDKDGITVFFPESPEKLGDLVHQAERRIKFNIENLNTHLPELRNLYYANRERGEVKVRVFEGQETFNQIYEDTLHEEVSEILVWSAGEWTSSKLSPELSKYFKNYVKRRKDSGVTTRVISTRQYSELLARDPELNKVRRYWSESLPAEIDVYGDKVAILAYEKELTGLMIHNRDFAETMRKIFNEMWNKLPKATPQTKTETRVSA